MTREHNIKWFLEDPTRLTVMKPFTRGGEMVRHGYESHSVKNNETIDTGFANLSLRPISQDTYITEYRPDLHHIILNRTIPHIKIVLNGVELPQNMMEVTQTASFQKLIHAAHVRNLTANPIEFDLFGDKPDEETQKLFSQIKQEWMWRGREWDKYRSISTCKKVGNVGTLFHFDSTTKKYGVTTFSYEDGYQIVPNYDEFGIEIARSLYYMVDGKKVIDTYDDTFVYHTTQEETGWETASKKHGFSRNPLLHKRGAVAWEYAESNIEMWELMANIHAIALKRFGTFSLVLWGDLDSDSFKRDSSTLIINLTSDTTNGRQDAKVLDFPEPQTMDGYLKTLEEKISLFSSTSFITPKDITTSNSGGNGIALAMSNDYSLATQSALDWQQFMHEMVYLHQEGLDLEYNNGEKKFANLKIGARIIPWSLETNNTKLLNLTMEAPYLSTQTILERCPDAAPDEAERVIAERGKLITREDARVQENADKANAIQRNRNDLIRDNEDNVIVEDPNVNT